MHYLIMFTQAQTNHHYGQPKQPSSALRSSLGALLRCQGGQEGCIRSTQQLFGKCLTVCTALLLLGRF